MPATQELVAAGQRLLLNNYRQSPLAFSHGQGCRLWDVEGRSYLDMTAGVAVCVLGHGHQGLADTIYEQARRLVHTSNLYYIERQLELAEALAERGFPGRLFFCNSGTEANEAALKLARRYQTVVAGQKARTDFIAFEGSFHGRTLGALSVTGQPKYHQGFEPLLPGVSFVPFGDLAAVERLLGDRTTAVIVEPIQGEGGVNIPPEGFLPGLRRLCSERGALLIFDEVQTGVGRTGTFYAFQQERDAEPDIVTLAKGLGGGIPIGAMLAKEPAAKGFEPGSHASTFGGNPLATAAALYVQKAMDSAQLLENCRTQGQLLTEGLKDLAQRRPTKVKGTRGRGLLQGLTVHANPADVVSRARDRGLLLTSAGTDVVRLAPPLSIGRAEIEEALMILDGIFADV